jgi:hypothetical protein
MLNHTHCMKDETTCSYNWRIEYFERYGVTRPAIEKYGPLPYSDYQRKSRVTLRAHCCRVDYV